MARYILVKEPFDWTGFFMLAGFALFMKALPYILLAAVLLWLLIQMARFPGFMWPFLFYTATGTAAVWIGAKNPILGAAVALFLAFMLVRRMVRWLTPASARKKPLQLPSPKDLPC